MELQILKETLSSLYKNRELRIIAIVLFYLVSVSAPIFSESISHYVLVKTGQIKEVGVWQTTPSPELIEGTFGVYNETQKWNTKFYSFKMKNTHPLKIRKILVDIDIYPDNYEIILLNKKVNIPPEDEEEIIFKVNFNGQGEYDIIVTAEDSTSNEIYGSDDWKAPIYK